MVYARVVRLWWLPWLAAGCGRSNFDPQPPGDAPRDVGDAPLTDSLDTMADTQLFAPCLPDSNLVACYAFELDTLDSTPNNNDGAATNVSFTLGRDGNAILVGATSTILVADSPTIDLATNFSIEAWVRLDADTAGRAIVADHNAAFAFYFETGAVLRCDLNVSGTGRRTPQHAGFAIGTWHHIACTYDGATLAAWVDGSIVASINVAGGADISNDPMQIGGNQPDSGNPAPERMIGAIDQFRLWRVVRSAQELCAAAGTC
jgi:hypothetical protein